MTALLTIEELKKLRGEIVLNSLYCSDYENSFGFNARELSNFFDGYCEELDYIMSYSEENYNDSKFFDLLSKYDTIENLYEYYQSLELDCINYLFVKK